MPPISGLTRYKNRSVKVTGSTARSDDDVVVRRWRRAASVGLRIAFRVRSDHGGYAIPFAAKSTTRSNGTVGLHPPGQHRNLMLLSTGWKIAPRRSLSRRAGRGDEIDRVRCRFSADLRAPLVDDTLATSAPASVVRSASLSDLLRRGRLTLRRRNSQLAIKPTAETAAASSAMGRSVPKCAGRRNTRLDIS